MSFLLLAQLRDLPQKMTSELTYETSNFLNIN